MTRLWEIRFYSQVLVSLTMHILASGTDVFECAYEKCCISEFDEEFWALLRNIFYILIKVPTKNYLFLLLGNFFINWILFCFVDPLRFRIFYLYVELYAITFFTACLTFIVWSYTFCKTAFQKVKTKMHDFWLFLKFKK